MWCTVEGDIEGAWIQYEFETLYQFHQIHVWNYNGDNEDFLGMGIKDALIKTSLDGETWSTYAQVELSRATGENDYLGEDVDMNDVVAQYLRIEILSQHGYVLGGGILVDQVGLSEVQFQCRTDCRTSPRSPIRNYVRVSGGYIGLAVRARSSGASALFGCQ